MKFASVRRLSNGGGTGTVASLTFSLTVSLTFFCHSARANCFDDAAAYHHVNANVLRAIAWQESHNQPAAKHLNDNGSVDYGVMQINSIHLRKLSQFGVNAAVLMEPCKNVYIAAWHLRTQIDHYGNTWAAVGAYHSATPSLRDHYAAQISHILRGWHFLDAAIDADDDGQGERRSTTIAKTKRKVLSRNSSAGIRSVDLTPANRDSTVNHFPESARSTPQG